ncbi:MAG TPA: protein adenylyltransferase SelO family protein, partial [Rhodopila sp.]
DRQGRYAYGNQPRIGLWNLTRLAECLLPLLGDNEEMATEALSEFAPRFEAAYLGGLRRKIGLLTERDGDDGLAAALLKLMAADAADFTLTFRLLADAAEGRDAAVRAGFKDVVAFDTWLARWRVRLAGETAPAVAMRAVNPAFIARNHRWRRLWRLPSRGISSRSRRCWRFCCGRLTTIRRSHGLLLRRGRTSGWCRRFAGRDGGGLVAFPSQMGLFRT